MAVNDQLTWRDFTDVIIQGERIALQVDQIDIAIGRITTTEITIIETDEIRIQFGERFRHLRTIDVNTNSRSHEIQDCELGISLVQ